MGSRQRGTIRHSKIRSCLYDRNGKGDSLREKGDDACTALKDDELDLTLLSMDLVNAQSRLVEQLLQLTPQLTCSELSNKKCQQQEKLTATFRIGNAIVTATEHGTVLLQMPFDVAVEVTLDGSVRLTNQLLNVAVAFNIDCTKSALLHSIGTIYQTDKAVEIKVKDLIGNNHKIKMFNLNLYAPLSVAIANKQPSHFSVLLTHSRAETTIKVAKIIFFKRVELRCGAEKSEDRLGTVKMFPVGACFTSTSNCLVYIIDEAGVRSTINPFKIASNDFSVDVFYVGCRHGAEYVKKCREALADIKHWVTRCDTHSWKYNDIIITQTVDGSTRILKNVENEIRVSPQWNAVSVVSPHIHSSASLSANRNGSLTVTRGSHSVDYDGKKLFVNYNKIASGFDESGQVALY